MNSKATKPVVLILVFIAALIIFSFLTNKVNKDLTTTMDEASLPVIQFVYDDTAINELHGYVREMDMLSMRDGLMPLGEERELELEIMTYGNTIDNLSYKIRSMDGDRLLAEEDNADIFVTQDKVECDITLPSIFEDNVEYNMEIVLSMGEKDVYYYTRIVHAPDCYVSEMLEFALTFHEYTFRDDAGSFIPTYMDPATGDATTLQYVDLSCTLGQITWADFEGVKLTEPVASFKEINSSYNVITLNYVMTNVNEKNQVEYYNVEEYYRLRQTPQRIYVLNYERTMNQVFRSDNDFLSGNNALLLGIRNSDVEFLANDSGDSIAFVQEGELWSYDRLNNTISQIFSFRSPEGMNSRENWNQHDIKIIRVDEAGSVSFIVSGYMNRGIHEGEVGVGVYHYDALAHTVEEEIFISSNKSYEVLQAELGQLMYVNEQKMFYFMLSNNVYKIDLTNFNVETWIESDTDECYAVSASGRYLAWVDSTKINSSTTIMLEDLKTGISYEITSGADTYLKPISFIGDDFVYGVAKQSNVRTDSVGNEHFLMTSIEILNTSEDKQDVIKTYRPSTGYIGGTSVDENNIYVELVKEENGRYVDNGSDTIMNRETEPSNGVKVSKTVSDIKQTQVILNMKEVSNVGKLKVITAKHILLEEDREIALDVETEGYYYVYVKGEVLLATTNASEAIHLANENYGVVVDSDVNYIFKRARSTSQSSLTNLTPNEADTNASSMAKCVSIMLAREGVGAGVSNLMQAGQTPHYILESALEDATVLELYDCTMDELLYFIDQGTPVFAKVGSDQAVLLTGYSSNYVYYYNPEVGQTQTIDYAGMEDMFYAGGNYCIAYVK